MPLLWSAPVLASAGREGEAPPSELLVGCITGVYEPREEGWKLDGTIVKEELRNFRWEAGRASADMIRTVRYEKVEFPEEIPNEAGVRMEDADSGINGIGKLSLVELEPVLQENGLPISVWQEDFSMVLTFRAYGAETYDLAGSRVSHREGSPPLEGYEEELLGLIGAGTEDHKITKIEWMGESYVDDYGIAYRNAEAHGFRKLTDYQTVYTGKISFQSSQEAAGEFFAGSLSGDEEPLPEESQGNGAEEQEGGSGSIENQIQQQTAEMPAGPEIIAAETGAVQEHGEKPGPGIEAPQKDQREAREERPVSRRLEMILVKNAEIAVRSFVESAEQAEQWIYQKTSVVIPWQTLIGGGLAAAVFFSAAWRKNKYSL